MTSNNKLFKKFLSQKSKLEGRNLRETDFIVECRTQWKSMTESQRFLGYNSSKLPKNESKNKSNSTQENEEKSKESEDKSDLNEEIENKLIAALIKYKKKSELMDTKFFFMSSNIQCVVNNDYRPLEIGIIEYTIRDGISLTYHKFIDCGDIPCGYAFEAINHMKTTHKIPVTDFSHSTNNYLLIGTRILEILSDSCVDKEINHFFNKPMIVFSKSEQMDQNKGALDWIAKKCNEMSRTEEHKSYDFNIKVLSATKLLSALLSAANDYHSHYWCENAITSNAFDYTIGTDCSFHEDNDCIECAIGVPKRIAYLMSYFLRNPFEIKLSEKHLPTVQGFDKLRIRIREEDDNHEKSPPFQLSEKSIN